MKPNILYMHTHDSGRYWSPYGHAVPAPNLMRLADDSTLFRHCYSAAPTCSPSRAALLTGMSPHACGMTGLAHRGFRLNDYSRHLAPFLGRQGYRTALCGIQHEAPDAGMIGYHELLGGIHDDMGRTGDSLEEWDRANTGCACSFLRECAESDTGEPFFLSMGWFNTHRKYPKAGSGIHPDRIAVPPQLYDCAETRNDMADYHESVRVVDECVGRILDTLDETGLAERTVVVMTTDHGIAFPHMKCTLYDTGIGVGLILRCPDNPMAGRATDALVSHLDVFPTLCALAGIDPPEWLEGVSLLPVLRDGTAAVRDEVFAEVTYHAAYDPMRCVRTDRYKFIRRYGDRDRPVVCNVDGSPSKSFLLENGGLQARRDREMLFDLWLDPLERENLAGLPECRDIRDGLAARLEDWMRRTADPLLPDGARVPKPAGARVNRQDCADPALPEYED